MFAGQLEGMLERGCSLIVGLVDDDGAPRATRAWGIAVLDESARRLRFTMSADDHVAVDDLTDSMVSLTGADVRTLQAVQLKGRVVTVGEPTDDDLLRMAQQSEAFFEVVHLTDGIRPERLKRILPVQVVAVEFIADEVYDQSPGPGAGSAMQEPTR